MAMHLLLLLLLFANTAFSIHQLLILRFLRPVVYVTLQITRINRLCVYSWPSHCVSLRTRFLQGSIVTTMQCLKNSAWTETMNMRLSGVTITFFFFANLQGSIAIAIICLKKGIVLSSHSFHCGCRAGLNILPIQKGFLTQGNICMACVRYLTCLCGSCRARQYTSIYVACTTAAIPFKQVSIRHMHVFQLRDVSVYCGIYNTCSKRINARIINAGATA